MEGGHNEGQTCQQGANAVSLFIITISYSIFHLLSNFVLLVNTAEGRTNAPKESKHINVGQLRGETPRHRANKVSFQ